MQQSVEWEAINPTQPHSHSTWHLLQNPNVPTGIVNACWRGPLRVPEKAWKPRIQQQGLCLLQDTKLQAVVCSKKGTGDYSSGRGGNQVQWNSDFTGIVAAEPVLQHLSSTAMSKSNNGFLVSREHKRAFVRQNNRMHLFPYGAYEQGIHWLSWRLDQASRGSWTTLLKDTLGAVPSQWATATHELSGSVLHHQP